MSVGGLGLVWCVAFWFTVYESPDVHPRIQKEEFEYIEQAMGSATQSPSVCMRSYRKVFSIDRVSNEEVLLLLL